jgi:hypothetical protein
MSAKWKSDTLIVGNSVVGCILQTATGDWEAAGCDSDWMDVELGIHKSRVSAQRAVQRWAVQKELGV